MFGDPDDFTPAAQRSRAAFDEWLAKRPAGLFDRLSDTGAIQMFGGELLDERTGAAIAEWVKGGAPVDRGVELLRKEAFEVAGAGTEFFTQWWNSAAVKPRRAKLRGDLDNLADIAREADAEIDRQRHAEAEAQQGADDEKGLDEPFARAPTPLRQVGGSAA